MDVVFYCIQDGRRFHRVILNGRQIFVGTRGECARFIEIHNEKVAQERIDNQRTPRSLPISIRTFRRLRAHA